MIQILLSGYSGRMGNAVKEGIRSSEGKYRLIGGIDPRSAGEVGECPVVASPDAFPGRADVIIDFSHHTALPSLVAYAVSTGTPLVVATTGHTEEELACLREAAGKVAVFRSGNMSLGINLLMALCRKSREILGDGYDVEIVEKHHNQKLDAPSGTALMLADSVKQADSEYVYDRHAVRRVRGKQEIGIHSVRGGTIVGEHEVMFCGKDEVVTLAHSALSREVFATGSLRAAEYLIGKPAGLYSMSDLVGELMH